MRLLFDRGTVLVADADHAADLAEVPGLVWDPRVDAYRAPAFRHAEVASGLARAGVRFSDTSLAAPRPAGWDAIALREYQRHALDRWRRAGRRGVVVLPTGSGKTRVGMAAMATDATSALCLVPTRVLLDQWWRELGACYRGRVGRLGDGLRELAPVTVATYASAVRHMAELGDRFELVVVDEAHHVGGGLCDAALEMCVARARLGLTATPVTSPDAAARIAGLVGPPVYELTIGDLAGTYLAAFDVVTLPVDLAPDERLRYDALTRTYRAALATYRAAAPDATWRDFARAAVRSSEGRAALAAWRDARRLVACCREKVAAIGDLLARHQGARALVFVADNAAAYAIAREHLVMPLTCDIDRAERAAALEAFRRGALRALVSARVLNEGLDVPDADVAIVAGGTGGEREHVQRVGRLLRPAPGKRALVYELVAHDTTDVHQALQRRKGLATRGAARLSHRR